MLILEGKVIVYWIPYRILAFKKGKVTSTPAGLRMNGIKWIIVRADQEVGTLYLKKVSVFFCCEYDRLYLGKWRSMCCENW